VTPLHAVSAAVRHLARYLADRASAAPPRHDIRPAAIKIISGSAAPPSSSG
jgi:hypothetical protein